jgi:hypothetical protein
VTAAVFDATWPAWAGAPPSAFHQPGVESRHEIMIRGSVRRGLAPFGFALVVCCAGAYAQQTTSTMAAGGGKHVSAKEITPPHTTIN